ncbi:type II toxin-antitoxin system RelE/ParE family toxin [Patescibacteria group bacterium]|nr:type II toxin-antitoxin system RelE/ParE family toxin [Patescibacteria group bacterium]MBU1016094.1 type II toxin-antitoxin system RelE/ParE family toxin [Patescibacteria group bacterium]MBU1684837.1 type II toxin-antitoxin system RelE/ParE family toxin [Patescibacteria group bacterium]MBU1938553.1 type II toxin-antitoxin system RelE/ParE family toxin [Patescibacteria group bacterium]
MIRSFKCKDTERLFRRTGSFELPGSIQRAGLIKLTYLNAAISLKDLSLPPGNRLKKLTGKRKGQYSIRINEQWRICFEWKDGDAYNVEIIDYH